MLHWLSTDETTHGLRFLWKEIFEILQFCVGFRGPILQNEATSSLEYCLIN